MMMLQSLFLFSRDDNDNSYRGKGCNGQCSTGVESPVLTAFLAVFAEEAVFFDVVGVGFLLFWSEGVTFSVSFVSYSDSVSGVVSDSGSCVSGTSFALPESSFLTSSGCWEASSVDDNSAFTGDIAILSGGDSAI